MRYCSIVLLCLMASCLTACAHQVQQRLQANERAAAVLQNDVAELHQRQTDMEQRLSTVNHEMSVLKRQPYPVKTTKGAKTNYVATAPRMPAPPPPPPDPASPAPYAADAPSPMFTPATVPPSQQQSNGWLSSYETPPPPSRGTGARAVPAPVTQGPRTLIPEQPRAAPAPPPKRPINADELALPPETAVVAPPPVVAPQTPATPALRADRQAPAAPAPQDASGQAGEEAIYNRALAEFNANRYSQAAAGFTELLYAHPTGRYAPNAGYWLGESLYGQNQYSDALAQFKEVTSRFPQHHKAPDALFKTGLCYMRLGDRENAALQFRALVTDYPRSPAANLARQRGFVR